MTMSVKFFSKDIEIRNWTNTCSSWYFLRKRK